MDENYEKPCYECKTALVRVRPGTPDSEVECSDCHEDRLEAEALEADRWDLEDTF